MSYYDDLNYKSKYEIENSKIYLSQTRFPQTKPEEISKMIFYMFITT
jgi:hypothetical protein